MTEDQAQTLLELGTRLEWAFPAADEDSLMLALLAPLFPWAEQGGASEDARPIWPSQAGPKTF